MFRRSLAAAMLILAAAACGSGGDDAAQPSEVKSITIQNPLHEQLQGLSELNRGLGLRRAIQDSGSRCKKVDEARFQGDYKALKMWVVRCSDTNEFGLFLAPSGDVQVRSCADLKALKLPECRFEGAAGPQPS